MALPNLWSRMQGLLFGGAIGAAMSRSLEAVLEPVRQQAWKSNQFRILDPRTLAELAARGFAGLAGLEDEAARNGYDANRLQALYDLAQRYPGLGEVDQLTNRKVIGPDDAKRILARHGYGEEWVEPLMALFNDLLTPGELAAAIHRGLVPNDGLVLGEQPEPPFNIDAYPVYPIDPVEEAAGSGYDRKRLGVLVGLQGLPMGVIEAAHSYWRKIITHGDYIRAFNTSNSRNEWAQAVLEYSRQIPTARDFLENALRGYTTLPEALAGAELHGMTEEHATLIYQNQGRPMNIRQITMALARGAKFNPEPGEIQDPYLASIVEGPIKPGYYELAESLKYTLPSVFTMRALAQAGVWSEAKTAERLKWAGWYPQDADEAAKAWAAGTGSAVKVPPVVKAQTTAAITQLRKAYVEGEYDKVTTDSFLAALDHSVSERVAIFEIWDVMRGIAGTPIDTTGHTPH